MKINVGGTIGFKIIGKPYETIEATTSFSTEKEVPDNFSKEALEEFFDKTNNILSREATKKMQIAVNEYKQKIIKLREVL